MGPISLSISVDASREQVFDFIVDLSARPAWTGHFAGDYRLERIPPAGKGAAARYRVDAPGGVRYMETVIAEAERPHLIVEHGRGGHLDRVPLRTVWELTQGSGVTEISLIFWTEPAAVLDKLREQGRSRWWRRRWGKALRRMRESIETGSDAAPRAELAGGDQMPAASH